MSENPFALSPSAYRRDLSVLKFYVQDCAAYLSKMTGRPLADCEQYVRSAVKPGGRHGFVDPEVIYLEREDNGDRIKKQGTLAGYMHEAIRNKELIAPTFTTYLSPAQNKSLLVDFIDGNVKARSKAKKEMFAAKVAGNKAVEAVKKIEQTGRKLNNNALSGAHVSASTPLYNKTAHSTLTSNCRSTAGYGNANNEKFLCGNRHYWSPDIVRNNIVSIINHSDYAKIKAAMDEFGIRPPTVDETMQCITYSASLYWRGVRDLDQLRRLVLTLSDLERSAFVYTGDLYHLMRFNDAVVRRFIDKLSARIVPEQPYAQNLEAKEVDALLKGFPEDYRNLASQICSPETKGKKVDDLKGTPAIDIYLATLTNINNTLQEYRHLIAAFWVTENVPASVAHFPDSIRRAAITSDTDSTIFSVQDWVIWQQGGLRFSTQACGVAATMIFLASQTITHVLARMSANFGIEEARIHQVAMKNEFYFPVFIPTQVAKHYYALIGVQEGNVFKEFEKEIKGVHLKSSNAPRAVMKEAEKMMLFIMNSVVEEKPINIREILKTIGDVERGVAHAIRTGSHEYFRRGQIKTADSYVEGDKAAPYQQYLLWQEVFAPKYGLSQNPPYLSLKLSADLSTPMKTKEWIASFEDRVLAARLEAWLVKHDKKHVGTTFMLPEQVVAGTGIPEEIMNVVGVRKIILDTTKVFYLILETLGVYMLNNKTTRLVSDQY